MAVLNIRKLFLIAPLLSGCQTEYLLKSGYHQAQLIRNRVSIDTMLKDPRTTDDEKRKIALIQEARQFAETQLGLTPTENYKSYVKLEGSYVTYLVQASPQYEVEHYLWSYPLVGSLPYKGFFEKEDAVKESNTLKQKGYDTMVRGVKAYSTLGWLKDPILSSMLTYKDSELVNLIIHESTHATLYIKSSADFNEQLASFVGNEGTEQFYRFKEGPLSETLKKILNTNHDEKMFSKFISEEIQKLKKWYADNPTKHNSNDKIARLQEINKNFVKIKREFVTTDFDFFEKSELNNAVLIGYKTYSEDMDNFEIAYKNVNKDMRRFLEVCKNLKNSKNPKEDLLNSK